jgi:hypothetical protein
MSDMEDSSFLLRRDAAAEFIRNNFSIPCTTQTLAKFASIGGGPLYRYNGRFPVYDPADLAAWVAERTGPKVSSVSEARAVTTA